METAVPGPFESKALTGTFEKDISCIQQNDIWSSETFNNFVNTVYKLFYTESSYDHIFRNAGPGVQARLLWEKQLAEDDHDGESLSVPVLRFTATETENWNHIAVGMAPATNPDDDDHFERLCLVYGNGDLSRSARSYAMIHILRENTTTLAEDHSQYDTTINDNYCIIQCMYNLQTGAQEVPRRRRFHDLSEFVLRYDRSIPAGNTVITVTAGDKLIPGSDVPVKYTFTFGKSATFNNFVECVNSLKYQNFPLYNAVLVGEAAAADRTLWQALEFADTGTSTVTSKVIRFVPVRPAVTFYGWPDPEDKIGTLLTYVRPEEHSANAEAVFKYTGTYGFVLDNSIKSPVIQYAGEFKAPLVYVPNKNNYHHYEPAQSGSSPYPLPDWYEALTAAGVSLGTTQDFSADYFFLPLLTVHEKYVEFAGMTVSLETLLDRGETDIAIVPGSADGTDLESEIKYDSYRFINNSNNASVDVREPLVNAADNVFEAFKPALNAYETDASVAKLGRGVFPEDSMLKTQSNAMALDRTLQAVVGLNWKLNNIIWIDPLLGPSDDESDPWKTCDRQRKMYPSVKLAVLDDVKFGRGSLITPDTVFIHVTDYDSDAPAYSNDPADTGYQYPDSIYHRNMWREIYSEYLPVGCRHVALRAVDGKKITDVDFRFDYDRGPAPLYIRLLQDPGLTYDGSGEYSSVVFTSGLNHLHCRYRLTGEDKDLDTDYYPLRGQDFSLTSNVIIDDPEAGMRVVEKLTNVRIRLYGIKAEQLSYVPRTHSLDSSTEVYYSQGVGIHMGGSGDPAYALNPSDPAIEWRPANWDKRGMLDWYLYNGEVLFQRCNINTLNQSIELNSSPVVKGSCISFLNVNAKSVKASILCQFGAAQPEPNGIQITIPAAGKLMLWRLEDYTCTAEVSELQLCGKGGTQVIEYAPVAWPFNVEYTSNASVIYVGSPAGVAYQYSVSSTGVVTGSASKNYLCRLGVSSPDSARITGGSIYLTLRLDDRTKEFIYNAETSSERLWPQDCETRYESVASYRQNFHSFIKLDAPVADCKFTVKIKDTGNKQNWFPPNSDSSDVNNPHYVPGTWQAFDPEIFLPLAPWVQTGDRSQWDWPANFTFLEGDSRSVDFHANPRVFNQCDILIDQSSDAVYWLPAGVSRVNNASAADTPYWISYTPCNMFFASRIFRKSAYIFYLAGIKPSAMSYSSGAGRIACSNAVNLTFVPGHETSASASDAWKKTPRVVLWHPEPENVQSPGIASGDAASYFTYKSSIFITGLESSRVVIPELKVHTVTRKTVTLRDLCSRSALPRQSSGTSIALFSGISDSQLLVGRLDTRYPLVDEWKYIADGYPEIPDLFTGVDGSIVYWAEPQNGFLLFTYPEYLHYTENVPTRINRNNSLDIGIWTTRTLLSGIHGLQGSSVKIAYDFTTQSFDLRMFSPASGDMWTSSGGDIYTNPKANMETLAGSKYYAAQRPKYWTQMFSDPGRALSRLEEDDRIQETVNYLPCLPVVYLSEVQDCHVDLSLASLTGYPQVCRTSGHLNNNDFTAQSIPCNTVNMASSGRRRLRQYTYNALAEVYGSVPHAGKSISEDESTPMDAYNARRTVRLALGFQIQRPDATWFLTAASGNKINGVFTRVNLVAGLYNHVAGWCYELVPTYINNCYNRMSYYYVGHFGDDSEYRYPALRADYYLGPSLLDNVTDIKAVRKLLTLDISVPGIRSDCPENEVKIFDILALQQWTTSSAAPAVQNGDSIPHMSTGLCDSLVSKIYSGGAEYTAASCPIVDWYQLLSRSGDIPLYSGGFLSVTDAYNTADLQTILLPTSDLSYRFQLGPRIPAFHPMHTVLAFGYPAAEAASEVERSLETSLPGLSAAARRELAWAIVNTEDLQLEGEDFSISNASLIRAGVSSGTLSEIAALAAETGNNVTASQVLDDNVVNPADPGTTYTFTTGNLASGSAFSAFLAGRAGWASSISPRA